MPSKFTIAPLALAALLCASFAAQAQEQSVKIGVTGPLSGANAFAGKDNENGVRLAIEELNTQKIKVAGKTLRFELQSEDDAGDPKQGVTVAQKFADAGVKFVLGPYNSGVAIPASRVYNDSGILMSTVGTKACVNGSSRAVPRKLSPTSNWVTPKAKCQPPIPTKLPGHLPPSWALPPQVGCCVTFSMKKQS